MNGLLPVVIGIAGAIVSGALTALTIGIFRLVSTVSELSLRVERIEQWIWGAMPHKRRSTDREEA